MNKKYSSHTVATCGIMGAFATIIMLMGGVIPFATFVAPAISGIILVPLAIELGFSSSVLIYIGISILSIIIVPDKEMAFIFLLFLGYYPILKLKIDKIKNRILKILLKFLIFNCAIFTMYGVVLYIFQINAIIEEFNGYSDIFMLILIIISNFTFYIYDMAIKRIIVLYIVKYRKRLFKNKHL